MTISVSRRSAVEPFHAMDVLAEANRLRAQGHDIVSMAVGQPSDPAPPAVRAAAQRALETSQIGYTDALGRHDLRERIARHYAERYGVEVGAERIVVTTGSSAGFNLAFLALFDVGDRVAITAPGYPAYRNILKALGLEAVEIKLGAEGYLTADLLEAAHRHAPLKGVLFASPANPTGAIIPRAALEELVGRARALRITAISDEIYHGLSYSEPDATALSFGDEAVIINSFSKYYCMTGWRIGWMVLPPDLVRPVERIQQSLYISAPELSQIAAIAAFDATQDLEQVKLRYLENRRLLADGLPALGLPILTPLDGAFYAYCDVSAHSNDSMDFAYRMLREAHVAATPGLDFDIADGHRTMRFSYAGSPRDMETALERLRNWLVR
jgi:aspartate/methionine/tyrosine aminotransferase